MWVHRLVLLLSLIHISPVCSPSQSTSVARRSVTPASTWDTRLAAGTLTTRNMMSHFLPRSLTMVLVVLALLPLGGCKPAADRQVHYRDRGAAFLRAKNYEKARIELANALQINPKDALARELAGEAAEALGNGPDALTNYLIAIELKPTMTHARARLARLYAVSYTHLDVYKRQQ